MRKPIEHTADIAYEISGNSYEELLEEARNILFEEEGIVLDNEEKEKTYPLEEMEDVFFDTVNDWILEISKGWAPWRIKREGNELKVTFRKIRKKEGTEIKALTYHLLKFEHDGDVLKTKVVFDT